MKALRRWQRSDYAAGDLWLVAGLAVAYLACLAALREVGVNGIPLQSYIGNSAAHLSAFVVLLAIDVLLTLAIVRPDKPVAYLRRYLALSHYPSRISKSLPILLALFLFLPAFSTMKSSIALFNAYSWDPAFIRIDRAIHGADPWRLLQPILGYPIVTSAISMAYHVWILLLYVGGIYFAIYERDALLRRRYFIAFFGIWIICGILLATLFASVGPCFVGPLFGINEFDQQMAYLHEANRHFPVMVLDVQQDLLDWYRHADKGLGRGLTAMPSLHVAQAFLFFLAMRHKSRRLGVAFGIFALVILLGSVHLGYHYAVDGYVSIAATAAIWWLAGKLATMRGLRAGFGSFSSIAIFCGSTGEHTDGCDTRPSG